MGLKSSRPKPSAFSLTREVIETIVDPIVSRIISKDLFLHLDRKVKAHSHPAAEDAYQTILLRLHVQLTNDSEKGRAIDNLQHLVAVIAHNV